MANVRKPAELHKLNGTFRKDRHGDPEQQLNINDPLPEPPDWLCSIAVREWRRIVDVMADNGVLRATDFAILAIYCSLFAQMVELKGRLHPQVIVQFRAAMNDLGLTPAARSKVCLPKKAKKGNDFANL